jgi:hypothetical protein
VTGVGNGSVPYTVRASAVEDRTEATQTSSFCNVSNIPLDRTEQLIKPRRHVLTVYGATPRRCMRLDVHVAPCGDSTASVV